MCIYLDLRIGSPTAYKNRRQFRKNLQPFVETKTQVATTLGAATDGRDPGLQFVDWIPPLVAFPGVYLDSTHYNM